MDLQRDLGQRPSKMDQPLWIIILDLSKAFDGVNWESLWEAVGVHGVSQHLAWILQSLYHQQRAFFVGSMEDNFELDMAAGVRQGCVLSPRFFPQSWNGHCPNGRRNAMVLATTSKTERFLY